MKLVLSGELFKERIKKEIFKNIYFYTPPSLAASELLYVEHLKKDCFVHEGADYMKIFNPVWKFKLVYRVEISFWINSKLLIKMTLQLHVKVSTRYTKLKFQVGLANPR